MAEEVYRGLKNLDEGMSQSQKFMGGPLTWQLEDLGKRIKLLEETLTQLKTLDLTLHEMQFIVYSYVEKIREGVVLIQDEILVWANKAACDIVGYEYDEVINKSVADLVHPKYRDQFSARFAMVQAGGEITDVVIWPFLTKTREIKHIKPFSSRVIYNGKPAIMVFFSDITEDKKIQDELALRAQMLDLIADAVFLLDIDGNIKYVNEVMCKNLGYSKDELIKMNIIHIHVEEQQERTRIRLISASPKNQTDYKAEYSCKDGSRLSMVVRGKIVVFNDKKYVLCVARSRTKEENL